MNAAQLVMQRIASLAEISEEAGRLTRTYGSPAMRRANELVAGWMHAAGMSVRTDALGNLIGHYPAAQPDGKVFLLGSHLDTVRDAGRFDGALGVVAAIACVQQLRDQDRRLPFAVEVVGFAEEEGVRFHAMYLGSRALAGKLTAADLQRTDARGISLAAAIREFGGDPDGIGGARLEPARLLGYAEIHIEQGPQLEAKDLAVGVVSTIAGQTRARVLFEGQAGHAGTVPMNQRQDALCAAAEFVLATEALAQHRGGLVATIGEIAVRPGASNVIPGEAQLTLDLRHPNEIVRERAGDELEACAGRIAQARGVAMRWQTVHEAVPVVCHRPLTLLLERAVRRQQAEVPLLTSGAGHDGAVMAVLCPVAMLFVRCQGGISHHPAESAAEADIAVALAVMTDFLELVAAET